MIGVESTEEQLDRTREKSVLLFSGGMDSVCMAHLLDPDVLLYLPHGNRYGNRETHAVATLGLNGCVDPKKIVMDETLKLGKFERPDAIIPSRNLLFITLAANYGERIYLGSMSGDRSLDKSVEFMQRMTEMLNYLYQPQHWCAGREFVVTAPFKEFTKATLVRAYLDGGGDPEALLTSYSCYRGLEKPCGHCKPCFRKWVALEANGIHTAAYFENAPWEADFVPALIRTLSSGGVVRGEEDDVTYRVLRGEL